MVWRWRNSADLVRSSKDHQEGAIWAVHLSLCGLSVIFSDSPVVVQALNKDEVDCISFDKAKMTLEYRQVALSNEKSDELPKTGAIQNDAEHVAKEAMDTRTMVHAATRTAATFPEGVDELVEMEEISEESNNKRKWLFGFQEVEGRKHRMVRAVGR